MSAFMDFRCTSKGCQRRFGALVSDDDEGTGYATTLKGILAQG